MKKVLIVEDDKTLSSICKKLLVQAQYDVNIAENGVEALAYLKKEIPDLILLGIIMPKMDGFEFLQKRNRIEEYKDIPVIIMSNCGQQSDIDRGRELGVQDYVVKSDQGIDDILKKVQDFVGV